MALLYQEAALRAHQAVLGLREGPQKLRSSSAAQFSDKTTMRGKYPTGLNSSASTEATMHRDSSASSSRKPFRIGSEYAHDLPRVCVANTRSSPSSQADELNGLHYAVVDTPTDFDTPASTPTVPPSSVFITSRPRTPRCRTEADLSDATVSPVSPDAHVGRRASLMSEATVLPDQRCDQVQRLLSDAIEVDDYRVGDDEFSFDARCRRDSLYSENTCTKVDHALENTEELLAKFRALSLYDEMVEPIEHNGSIAHGDESSLRYSPTSSAKDGPRMDEDMISSFINYAEEVTFDPEVLALMNNSDEVTKLLKELARLGENFRAYNFRGRDSHTEVEKISDSKLEPHALAGQRRERRTSTETTVDIFSSSLDQSRAFTGGTGSCMDSFSSSSALAAQCTSDASPSLHLTAQSQTQNLHRSCNESLSSSRVAYNGVDSSACSSPPVSLQAPLRLSGDFVGRSMRAPVRQASPQNPYRSPRISLDGSLSTVIRSPQLTSRVNPQVTPRVSPPRSVKVRVASPAASSVPRAERQSSPSRPPFFGGYDRIISRMRQVATADSEDSAMATQHNAQSAASRIVQTAFGACGTSGPSRRSVTASPSRPRVTTASPSRQPLRSPSLRPATPVATPRLVAGPSRATCQDMSSTPSTPVNAGMLSPVIPENGVKQYVWEPVSVTTAYRLRPVT
mmetsp:Transcript_66024/g.103076  ORF Transcript_66024/g.103076 Transcript_66024/m.103076 type:complete len:682 (+) Transcript_66024:42-2087(+)